MSEIFPYIAQIRTIYFEPLIYKIGEPLRPTVETYELGLRKMKRILDLK